MVDNFTWVWDKGTFYCGSPLSNIVGWAVLGLYGLHSKEVTPLLEDCQTLSDCEKRPYWIWGLLLSCHETIRLLPLSDVSTHFIWQIQKTTYISTVERNMGSLIRSPFPISRNPTENFQTFHSCYYGYLDDASRSPPQETAHLSIQNTLCKSPSLYMAKSVGAQHCTLMMFLNMHVNLWENGHYGDPLPRSLRKFQKPIMDRQGWSVKLVRNRGTIEAQSSLRK